MHLFQTKYRINSKRQDAQICIFSDTRGIFPPMSIRENEKKHKMVETCQNLSRNMSKLILVDESNCQYTDDVMNIGRHSAGGVTRSSSAIKDLNGNTEKQSLQGNNNHGCTKHFIGYIDLFRRRDV